MKIKTARSIVLALNQLLLSASHENVGDLEQWTLREILSACEDVSNANPDLDKDKRINVPGENRVAMLYLLLNTRFVNSSSTPNMVANGSAIYIKAHVDEVMQAA